MFTKKPEKKPNEKQTTINALPEYEIRTMKDDLDELGFEKLKKEGEKIKKAGPPKELPIVIMPEPPKPVSSGPAGPKPKKGLIWLLSAVIVLIVIGVFFFWQGAEKPPLPPDQEPQDQLPDAPEALIPVNETAIIHLAEDSLIDLLKQEAEKDQPIQTFKQIAVLKQQEFLSLNELLEELFISVPPYALSELEDNYTLVLYSQDKEKRLGLIIKSKNADNLKEQLGFWEQTMVSDLESLFLTKSSGTPATDDFQDNTYQETAIRYINFPDPDLTIDYAIKNNLFILTTSKESMYKAIDVINQ